MTDTAKEILDEAEKVILARIKKYQETLPETERDIYGLQTLVFTEMRIEAARSGVRPSMPEGYN